MLTGERRYFLERVIKRPIVLHRFISFSCIFLKRNKHKYFVAVFIFADYVITAFHRKNMIFTELSAALFQIITGNIVAIMAATIP